MRISPVGLMLRKPELEQRDSREYRKFRRHFRIPYEFLELVHLAKHLKWFSAAGRPGSSEVPRNPLTHWDVSSIPANGIFLTKNLKNKIKMPNGWRMIKSLVHKIRLHSRRGKEGMAESFSREKLRHAPQKEGG